MDQQTLAVLLLCTMLVFFGCSFVTVIAYWMRSGRIRKSSMATRREKNMRHLMTIITLGVAFVSTVICMAIEPRVGSYFLLGTAFFALFIAPMRTLIVEMGLRRTKVTRQGVTRPSSIDLN